VSRANRMVIDMSGRGLGPGRLVKLPSRGDAPAAWYGIWTDAQRRRHKVKLATDLRVAEQAFNKIRRERDLELNGLSQEQGQNRLLSEIIALYLADLATFRRPRYVKAVGYTLDALMAELGPHARVRDASVPRLLLYRRKRLAAGISNRTANADAGTLSTCLRWALASGYIAINPLENLRPLPETEDTQVKKRRALSDDEIGRLLTAAIEDDAERASRFAAERTIASGVLGRKFAERERMVPIPQAPFWKFLVVTGLRYNEAATLRWTDLDETEGIARVRAEVAKSKRSRMVPVPGYMIDDLRALRQVQAFALGRMPEAGDRLFLSPKHRPLDPHGNPARLLLTRLLERAGIPYLDGNGGVNVDIHALRRTAGTRLARHSVPLATVSAIMGHSDVRLTQRYYIDLRIADTKKAVEGVPEISGTPRSDPAQSARSGSH
jgi:integrase